MKTVPGSLIVVLAIFLPPLTAFSQGGLTPSGAPAPTMKTLQQVEPRIPINSTYTPGDADSLFRIVRPGSYYVTTNLSGEAAKHGIEVAASGVTLDLMGFSLIGTNGSLSGIHVSTPITALAIRNGTIRSWSDTGVNAAEAENGLYEKLQAVGNGMDISEEGLVCGANSVVTHCSAMGNAGVGISAGPSSVVSDCAVYFNSGDGLNASIGSTINHCTSRSNLFEGMTIGGGSTVTACSASANGDDGFEVGGACTLSGCTALENSGDGIEVSSDSHVSGNTCSGNTDAGIHAIAVGNRIESNLVEGNGLGIDVDSTGSLIIRNSARVNAVNYSIAANNKVGPIVAAPNSGAIFGDSGGAGIGTNDAWANITY
jgi:parallel beta-helix repeat protein